MASNRFRSRIDFTTESDQMTNRVMYWLVVGCLKLIRCSLAPRNKYDKKISSHACNLTHTSPLRLHMLLFCQLRWSLTRCRCWCCSAAINFQGNWKSKLLLNPIHVAVCALSRSMSIWSLWLSLYVSISTDIVCLVAFLQHDCYICTFHFFE